VAAVTSKAPIWWMAGTSVGSWLATAPWFGRGTGVALLLGMLGPLGMALASWAATERAYRRNPARVTSVMMAAFGIKMLFVGAYLMFMLRGLDLQPLPFVASFTSNFIVLYGIEALFLKKLFAGAPGGPR
jgi:hypothetical protein